MQDLPPVGDDFFSTALGINHSREVTGVSIGATTTRAALWREGVPTDLNTLIANSTNLYLITACSITDRGQIIGLAVDPNTNEAHGYLATPTWSGGDAVAKPVELPESVRVQALKQLRFGHFASPQ